MLDEVYLMSFHLSFDKYLTILDKISKVQTDYKNFKNFDDRKKEIEAAYREHLSDAKTAHEQLLAVKRFARDTYDKMVKFVFYVSKRLSPILLYSIKQVAPHIV